MILASVFITRKEVTYWSVERRVAGSVPASCPACTSAGCYAGHVLVLTSGCSGEAREEISPVSLLCLRQGKHTLLALDE